MSFRSASASLLFWSFTIAAGACGGGNDHDSADLSVPSMSSADAGVTGPSCTTDSDCAAAMPQTSPAGCAVAKCDPLQGVCSYLAKDDDGDGHRAASCKSLGGAVVQAGDDCDDQNPKLYPGANAQCSEIADGGVILFPGGTPKGPCQYGTQTCNADGTTSACLGAVAPAPKDSCVPGNDDSCDGTPNQGCACVIGTTQKCGVCGTGTQTCDSSGWGTCTGGAPPNYGSSCGSCGGTIQCNGQCSVSTPTNYGQPCNNSCGTIQCNGQCSNTTPNPGSPCNDNCGSVQCNGSCSNNTPNVGGACNAGCGTVQCNGSCSNNTPNVGGACNANCGTVQCNGGCSNNTPNVGGACPNGCGVYQCDGSCSQTYGNTITYNTFSGAFSCCFINRNVNYGGACTPGYAMANCTVTKTSGGGSVTVVGTGTGGSCTCTVNEKNIGTEGATYAVTIQEVAICSNWHE